MKIIYPPAPIVQDRNDPSLKIFLAGSIEMGAAVDWQKEITARLATIKNELTIYNPRRADWDSTWEQSIDNPHFFGQVTWELDALDAADEIVMYFDPNTKSPISLLELGLYAESSKLTVICPKGFWRKGNVDIVCQRYGIQQLDSIEAYVEDLRVYLP